MQEIKLNQKLFSKVYSGKKTATTRKGLKPYVLGDAVFVNPSNEQERIKVKINTLRRLTWREVKLSADLYVYEGYERSSDLDDALIGIYGEMDPQQEMTVIYFKPCD